MGFVLKWFEFQIQLLEFDIHTHYTSHAMDKNAGLAIQIRWSFLHKGQRCNIIISITRITSKKTLSQN